MRRLKSYLWISVLLVLVCVLLAAPVFAEKYALLISSGEATADDQVTNSEYWYDLFLTYQLLVEDGFTHDNIYVLYGDGSDFISGNNRYRVATYWPTLPQITDYAVSKNNVDNMFSWLANGNIQEGIPQLRDSDFLFFWWMGHGSQEVPGQPEYRANIYTGETIRDDEFAAYFNRLPASLIKTSYVMTCFSGGIVDDLEGLHMMVHSASDFDEFAYSDYFDTFHAEFSYHMASAFREETASGQAVNSDTNGDGDVSVNESNDYIHTNTMLSDTQIGDYRNIAPEICLTYLVPDSNVPQYGVYSRDFAEDNGLEPSYFGYIWWEGPDLWVRRINDDEPENQDPVFGLTNYVYGRIHNIGNTTLDVDVTFSWCEQSAWNNMNSWYEIDTVTIYDLASSETVVTYVPWNTVPAPGKYCLHTVLEAQEDPSNNYGEALFDNNKVQINVTVEDNFGGMNNINKFNWVLENGIDDQTVVDLVIEKLSPELDHAVVQVLLPIATEFGEVINGTVKTTADFIIFDMEMKTEKMIILGIPLKPSEKKEAILALELPEEVPLGEEVMVKITEEWNEKEVGGIKIHNRAASKQKVMVDLFKKLGHFFEMLKQTFDISDAAIIAEFCFERAENCKFEDPESAHQAMLKLVSMEEMILDDLKSIMPDEEFRFFEEAYFMSLEVAEANNAPVFLEAQEDLMYSTKQLFLRKFTGGTH